MSAQHTPGSNNGTISRAEIMRHLRFELADSKNTGRGPRRITLGLHFAESIIHHLRKDDAAPELLEALEMLLTAESEGNVTNADRAHCQAIILKARGEP